MQNKKERSLWLVARRLWGHMGRHRRIYLLGLALGLIDGVCQTCTPMVFRWVLNELQADAARFLHSYFWPAVGSAAALVLVFFPAAFFFHVLVAVAVARLTRDLRRSLYQHVQRLSADFFQRHRVGEITQRLNNDIDMVGSAGNTMMLIIWHFCVLSWSLGMMFWIDWRLSLLFNVLMVGVTLWSRYYLPRLRSMNRSVRDAIGEVSATITEFVSLNDLIKSFTSEEQADARVHHRSNVVRKKTEALVWQQFLFGDIMQVLTRFVAPLGLLLTGSVLLIRGYMRIGDLVAFWGFWLLVGGSLNNMVMSFTHIFTGLASADRVFEFFDEQPMVRDASGARELSAVRGEIRFDAVSFGYPSEKTKLVLEELDLHVPAGRRIAIVGPSGAGKSTILQLVLRFYDPVQGRVTIDGQDLRELTQESLRANIGMVMQDSVFFAGTIQDNLRLAKPDASLREMRQALAGANALEFIQAMPSGMATVLGERGVRLSGGQKQRLSIARVFLKDPPILLFDEATSSLDSLAERLVQEAMERLMHGRTTIIVAHRIATVRRADQILVLENGRITAAGKHEELLQMSRLYYDLCSHQQLL